MRRRYRVESSWPRQQDAQCCVLLRQGGCVIERLMKCSVRRRLALQSGARVAHSTGGRYTGIWLCDHSYLLRVIFVGRIGMRFIVIPSKLKMLCIQSNMEHSDQKMIRVCIHIYCVSSNTCNREQTCIYEATSSRFRGDGQ